VSSADGAFVLRHLNPGVYEVTVRMLGYEPIVIDSVLVQANRQTELAPELVPKVYEVHEIQVTASRHETLEQSVPQLVSVVSRQKIQERSISQTPEILREEMGLVVQKTSSGGGSPIIRGLRANKILFLVDGIRMNNAIYRSGNLQYLNTINPASIERMEVVHGPTSVLYGTDALGGTINAISPTPGFSQNDRINGEVYAVTGYSSADATKYLTLQASLADRRWSLSMASSWYRYGDVRRGSHGGEELMRRLQAFPETGRDLSAIQKPNAYSSCYTSIKFHFQPHEKHRFTLAYEYNRQDDIPRYDVFERRAYDIYFYDPQNRDLAYLKYENSLKGPLADKMYLTMSFHRQEEGQIKQRVGSSMQTEDNVSVSTYGWQLQFNKVLHKNDFIIYGAEGYYDRVSTSSFARDFSNVIPTALPQAPLYPDGSTHNNLGLFIQNEWHADKAWMVTTGLRYSAFQLKAPFGFVKPLRLGTVERQTSALTASLGAKYDINPAISAVGNIAQGFRSPNLDDVSKFGLGKGGTFYDIPNPDITSEKALSFDGGLKFNSENGKVNVVAYYTRLSDVLIRQAGLLNGLSYFMSDGDTIAVYYKANAGNAYVTGFEFGAEMLLKWGIWGKALVNFTHGQNTSFDEPLSGIPPLNGLLALRWNNPNYWSELNSRFASAQARLSEEDMLDLRIPIGGTPGWMTLNFRMGVKVMANVKLNFALMNIMDLNYREHLSGLNAPGRSVVVNGEVQLF
ncbi:TonB-dependent receptor, partial [candidate division KSB1 bacterium]|nr:TonB-dependent receptor [candidate division KSB1 bacterium]